MWTSRTCPSPSIIPAMKTLSDKGRETSGWKRLWGEGTGVISFRPESWGISPKRNCDQRMAGVCSIMRSLRALIDVIHIRYELSLAGSQLGQMRSWSIVPKAFREPLALNAPYPSRSARSLSYQTLRVHLRLRVTLPPPAVYGAGRGPSHASFVYTQPSKQNDIKS